MALYPGSTTFPHVDTFPAPVVTVFNRLYTPAQVASSFGGDVYTFDYAHADVADTFAYGAGNWGSYYISSGDLNVTDAVRPVDSTQHSAIVFNVLTSHLDNVASAHIHYEGEGIIVSYTTNNAFTTLR
jgi:hypothetical protein